MQSPKKIGILVENRFIDQEIIYYTNRFQEEGIQVDLLTRLWGQPSLTFKGLELNMELRVDKSFEDLDDNAIKEYSAIITPAGYVADYLRYAEKPGDLAPAVKLIKKIMGYKSILKCNICHSLWIFDPIPEMIKDRKVTCHNNIIGSVTNAGGIFVDEDIVLDGDLLTARAGNLFAPFARRIIEEIL